MAYRMWVSAIGTGLIIAGKPVPLVAVSVARMGAAVLVRALKGGDYLANQWQGPWVSLGITDDPTFGRLGHSSGGGGPGESPTSTDSPPVLHQQGPLTLDKQGQPVPVVVPAASNSAHGGGRSGAKPRYCPRGYYWDRARKKCMPLEGPNDYRRFKRRYRRKG